MKMSWQGVIPAITTPFDEKLAVDSVALTRHCEWMIAAGCTGVVALGSLGEAATLAYDEKLAVLKTCVEAMRGRAPVVAGISALSTQEAVTLAKDAEQIGCSGLMVLPPYVYLGDWRETKAHIAAILSASELSCMLYNNPIAYQVDFVPEQVKELAGEHANLQAIKESSADVRRVMALRLLLDEQFKILVGVDDVVVEAVEMGAVGWIAGLVNAFPAESVELFKLTERGEKQAARELYRWFLPLLRMDTVPKFVQLIKLAQEQMGVGSERVRPPRLRLEGGEREEALRTIEACKQSDLKLAGNRRYT